MGTGMMVDALGWELRCVSDSHHKFYRTVIADLDDTSVQLIHYGRIGTAGNIQAKEHPSLKRAFDQAKDKAVSKLDPEQRKSADDLYTRHIDATWFRASTTVLTAALHTRRHAELGNDLRSLFESFEDAARRNHTTVSAMGNADLLNFLNALHAAYADGPPPQPATPAAAVRPHPRPTPLPAVGPQQRPNGETYLPRAIGAHEDLALVRSARDHHEPLLLHGKPGTGKSALIEAAFARDGGVETLVASDDTTVADLVGTLMTNPITGDQEWIPGPLHRAVAQGRPLFVDEIALADPTVLSVLYPLMDGRDTLTIDANPKLGPMPVAPGFTVLAAYNPGVPGAVLSPALRDRFVHHLSVTSDWQLALDCGVDERLVTVAQNLEAKRLDGSGEVEDGIQLRTLLQYRDLKARYGEDYALANLLAKTGDADRPVVHDLLENVFGRALTPAALAERYAL